MRSTEAEREKEKDRRRKKEKEGRLKTGDIGRVGEDAEEGRLRKETGCRN